MANFSFKSGDAGAPMPLVELTVAEIDTLGGGGSRTSPSMSKIIESSVVE